MGRRVIAAAGVLLAVALCGRAGAQDARWMTPTAAQIDAIYPAIEALYIDLHKNPELAFQETQTAAKLAAHVKALGFDVTTGVGGTGVVAILKNGAGPTVMLRTELDALPVQEKTGLPYASTVSSKNASGQAVPVMHACGHDLHMSAWAGTARLMAENRDRWRGTLMMVGQPAEEGGAGAPAMLKDGLFTRFPRPDYALSLHDDDTMPSGTIGYHPGLFRAMSDSITITVFGRGGHAAMPHNTIDPIVLSARIVLALQTVVSRENNPVEPVVITVGSIQGGSQANIIPDEVRLQVSVRTFTPEVRERTLAAIRRITANEARAAGAPREPRIDVPAALRHPVQNDPNLTLPCRSVEETSRRKKRRRDAGQDDVGGFRGVRRRRGAVGAVAHRRCKYRKARGGPRVRDPRSGTTFAGMGAGSGADSQGRDSRRGDRAPGALGS